jgi:hypothetical protein
VDEDAGAVWIAGVEFDGERGENPGPTRIGHGDHAGERILGDGDELGVNTCRAAGDDAELDHCCGPPPERGRIVNASGLVGRAAQRRAMAGIATVVE